jgi:uncharacterized protein
VAVRLCDVAPNGESLLVSRGLLNLCHRDGHLEPKGMPVAEPTVVSLPLDFAGHSFAPGHRIRVSVSPTYWPFAWPSPEAVTLDVHLGAQTAIELPVRPHEHPGSPMTAFGVPERTAPLPGHVEFEPWRTLTHQIATGRVDLDVGAHERTRLDRDGLEFGERLNRRYVIYDRDPQSARVECAGDHFLSRGDWQISIRVRTTMSATRDAFLITSDIDAFEGTVRVHTRRSEVEIARDFC